MSASELAVAVREALAVDPDTFREAALAEAEQLKTEVREGTFDNTQALVGGQRWYLLGAGRSRHLRPRDPRGPGA